MNHPASEQDHSDPRYMHALRQGADRNMCNLGGIEDDVYMDHYPSDLGHDSGQVRVLERFRRAREMAETGEWQPSGSGHVQALQQRTAHSLRELSQAEGNPLSVVLNGVERRVCLLLSRRIRRLSQLRRREDKQNSNIEI